MAIKKNKILYIHGFMSGGNSMTVKRLEKHYGYIFDFITPELDGNVDKSLKIINKTIETEKPVMIIGSSLGGFYASVCNSGDIPVLVVNPCVNPYEHLKRYLGSVLKYHCKRNDKQETYEITKEEIEKFKNYDIISSIKSKGNKISAILSINDEILGDTHLSLFEKIRNEETSDKKVFIAKGNFGHCAYPFGISDICDFIYETLF